MLVSKDIWALVEQEPEAFRASQLHDVTIVINAFDFMHAVLRDQKILCTYGGEYTEMAVKFDAALRNFLRCNLRPIFVFGGIVKADTEPKSRLLCLQKHVMSLDKFITSEIKGDRSYYFNYIPVFAKETLVAVLNNLDIKHVTCDAETLPACVGLAAYLRCPLVADGADVLLYEFEDPVHCDYAALADRFVLLPLRFLSTDPLPLPTLASPSSNGDSNALNSNQSPSKRFCLVAHVFCPSVSRLSCLLNYVRPFFALYLQPPMCEQFPLPQGAPHPPPRNPGLTTAAELAKTRVDFLISWLSQVSSPLEIFERTVSVLPKHRTTLFIQRAFYITHMLTPDFDQGHQLASFLQLKTSATDVQRVRTSVDLISWLNSQRDGLLPKFNWLFAVLDAELEVIGEVKRFLASVPANFLHFYRSGLVSPVMFARLFSGDWVLHPMVEHVTRTSVTDCSTGLRFLQYCLTLGFAVQCGHITLEEASAKIVSETSRAVRGSLKTERMRLRPFFLPMSKEPFAMCSAFLHQHVGYKPVEETDPEWLQSLALAFVIWYVHRETDASGPFDLFAHPPALSVALVACAVASSSSVIQQQDDRLRSLAGSLESDQASKAVLGTLSINAVHDISQIQLVYMSLLSLVRMIDLINFTNGSAAFGNKSAKKAFTVMSFLPGWVPFACTRLLHHISVLTACQKVDERRESASKIWLPKLLCDESEVTKAEHAFAKLADLANSMCTVHPIKFESTVESVEALPPQSTSNPIDGCQRNQFVRQRHSDPVNGSTRSQTPSRPPHTSVRPSRQSAAAVTNVDPRSRSPNGNVTRLPTSQPRVMRGFANGQRRPLRYDHISGGSSRALGDVRTEAPTPPRRGGFQPRRPHDLRRQSSHVASRPSYQPSNQSASSAWGQMAIEAAVQQVKATAINQE